MSRAKDREETIAALSREGVPIGVIRALLRAGATLHRLAELECSSEAADRDRVKCPTDPSGAEPDRARATCLCQDYGNFDHERQQHGTVPRIAVQGDRLQRRIEKLCAEHHLSPIFQGDPRGAVLLVKVGSGATNDWGGRGIFVA